MNKARVVMGVALTLALGLSAAFAAAALDGVDGGDDSIGFCTGLDTTPEEDAAFGIRLTNTTSGPITLKSLEIRSMDGIDLWEAYARDQAALEASGGIGRAKFPLGPTWMSQLEPVNGSVVQPGDTVQILLRLSLDETAESGFASDMLIHYANQFGFGRSAHAGAAFGVHPADAPEDTPSICD